MPAQIGNRTVKLGTADLSELRSSNELLHDVQQLRARLQEDGYLLLRGFHDRDTVLQARMEFIHKLQSLGRLHPDFPAAEGVIGADNKSALWGGATNQLQADFPAFLQVVNSPKVMHFFDELLDGPTLTYDYKWPRVVGHGGNTGVHYDIVYMGRGSKNVYTMWTPLDDIPLERGTLALCLGSQHFDIVRQTYGQMDVDRDNVATGWLSEDPYEISEKFGGQWASTEFAAGDVIIFGMFMMHASLINTTDRYRFSSDTRYQLASEPVDERWIGARPKGHYAWGKTPLKTVEKARQEWGI
jgi:hypothetical protein